MSKDACNRKTYQCSIKKQTGKYPTKLRGIFRGDGARQTRKSDVEAVTVQILHEHNQSLSLTDLCMIAAFKGKEDYKV